MTEKILFVDDEASLLNGIQRRLSLHYNLMTATCGADAIQVMKEAGPFAVVVTDMRMPEMDGIEYVKEARKFAPDTVYMMLTGNQDLATAAQAVNDGQVFRFMNKPCPSEELRKALDAGLKQYRLVTGEKEMLHKTFCGAVGILTDVLELTQSGLFSSASNIDNTCMRLREKLGIEHRWEYKMAGKLSMLGFALMSEGDRGNFERLSYFDHAALESLRRSSATAGRIIERIPRLKPVAEIISGQADVDGSLCLKRSDSEESLVRIGATLLRVALHWQLAARRGLCLQEAMAELRHNLPNLTPTLQTALEEIDLESRTIQGVELPIGSLKEGMVLFEDVITTEGGILLRKGRQLSWTVIERLKNYHSTCPLRPINVVAQEGPISAEMACV